MPITVVADNFHISMTHTESLETLKEIKLGLWELFDKCDEWSECIQQEGPKNKDVAPFN